MNDFFLKDSTLLIAISFQTKLIKNIPINFFPQIKCTKPLYSHCNGIFFK